MFQYMLAFCKYVCPLSIASMSSSSCWFVHLACLDALKTLLVLAKLCIDVMGGWHCCCVGVRVGYERWVSCVVGVIGWGCQFFWSSNMVPKYQFVKKDCKWQLWIFVYLTLL
jgi:hypothetical protein